MTATIRPLRPLPARQPDLASALLHLQHTLTQCRDMPALLAAIARDLPALVPVRDRVSLALLEPDGQSLRVYRLIPEPTPHADLPRMALGNTVVGQVARDGQPRVVGDVRDDDNLRFGRASHDGVRSTASVPVRVAGRVVGVLNIGSRRIGACADAMLPELALVAAVVGPAVLAMDQATAPLRGPVGDLAEPVDTRFIGTSAATVALLAQAKRAAKSDAPVLITGETGVGKSLLAQAIHAWSPRHAGPFGAIHVADMPPSLIESELFGHERGAFTGATHQRTGRFEAAHGGTLFLDEIGEVALAVQSKLLRVAQEGRFERLGSSATRHTEVRIVAATNRDLHDAVAKGEFRRDLLYRLEIVGLHVAPLRDRLDDLAPLAEAILARLSQKLQRPLRLAPGAWARMRAHPWPGNVRELESVLLRAALLEDHDELQLAALSSVLAPAAPTPTQWLTRDENERRYLVAVLQHTGGRIDGPHGAAQILDLQPSTLRSRMQRLGLQLNTTRQAQRS